MQLQWQIKMKIIFHETKSLWIVSKFHVGWVARILIQNRSSLELDIHYIQIRRQKLFFVSLKPNTNPILIKNRLPLLMTFHPQEFSFKGIFDPFLYLFSKDVQIFLTIWMTSSSWSTWLIPTFCGWCFTELPQTQAYLYWRIMPLWMRLQNSSTVGFLAWMITGSV